MVSWLKNGEALDKKRVNIRSTDRDSILFIRSAEREDSGTYEMCVKVEDFEDKAALILQIVGEQTAEIASEIWKCRPLNKNRRWDPKRVYSFQSCRGLLPAWRLRIPGVLMSLWSGLFPATMETQRSPVTQFRRQTKRLEWVYIEYIYSSVMDAAEPVLLCLLRTGSLCWTITTDWTPPSLTSSWVTPTSSGCFLKTSVE